MAGASRYANCFYYFRGPSSKRKPTDAFADQQVEDNTTKALVNLLEHSDRAVTSSFLKMVWPGRLGDADATAARYHLQGGPDSTFPALRVLLGISTLGEIQPGTLVPPVGPGGSRVDAAVVLPETALLAIEVKLGTHLDGAQLWRHAARWEIPTPTLDGVAPPEWPLLRWADVFRWARQAYDETDDPTSRFLLKQFAQYLQITDLAPFAGFDADNFAFFSTPTLERQLQLKARLSALWEAVLEELGDAARQLLSPIHVGQLGLKVDAIPWAQTNYGQKSAANLTIELRAEELQVNLVGWRAGQAERVMTYLTGLNPEALDGFSVVPYVRKAYITAKGTPWWQKETLQELDPVSGDFGAGLETARASIDPVLEKLAVHVRRSWPAGEVIAVGEQLAPRVATVVERLIPILASVNGWTSAN